MPKKRLAIPLAVLAVAGLAGGAYAATQSSSSPQQAFINDVARRLHVTPAQLTGALKQALIDRVDAAVAAGRLTRAQGEALKQRIQRGGGLLLGPGFPGPPQFGPPMLPGPAVLAHPVILTTAASYLGLSGRQLMQRLQSGKSLAQIATAQGKSAAGLVNAITSAIRPQLDQAVRSGHMPRSVAQRLLDGLARHIQDIVNMRLPSGPPPPPGRLHFFRGRPESPPGPEGWLGPLPPPAVRGWLGPPRA